MSVGHFVAEQGAVSHRGRHRSHLNSVSGESRGARGAAFAEISSLDTARNLRVTGEGSRRAPADYESTAAQPADGKEAA